MVQEISKPLKVTWAEPDFFSIMKIKFLRGIFQKYLLQGNFFWGGEKFELFVFWRTRLLLLNFEERLLGESFNGDVRKKEQTF